MTNEEFSNQFDTLVSAYAHLAGFGEQNSMADVALDEYEKSIFLTQALDLIVKSYFERTLNSQGVGFDDSSKRQLDYSNLITTVELKNIKKEDAEVFSDKGIVLNFATEVFGTYTDTATSLVYSKAPLFIINEKINTATQGKKVIKALNGKPFLTFTNEGYADISIKLLQALTSSTTSFVKCEQVGDVHTITLYTQNSSGDVIDEDSNLAGVRTAILNYCTTHSLKIALECNTSLSVNDIPNINNESFVLKPLKTLSYVVVPINYKEYDRMMSRAYNEPLKRQAWRLFETDSSTLNSSVELILRSDAAEFYSYKVRYIRRPRPIVLVDLTDTSNDLSIDNVKKVTLCELNPVLHEDILQLAVLLALTSKGIETRDMKQARQAAEKDD